MPTVPPARAGLARRTPPAIFPPILGLLGVGLAWRAWFDGTDGAGAALAEVFLGGVAVLYAVALAAWLAKPLRRPSVLAEEIVPLPGLAGMAAACLSGMLLAAALARWTPGLALGVVVAALAGIFLVGLGFIAHLLRLPAGQRAVTPVWHLVFVGPIVSAQALAALGYPGAVQVILIPSIALTVAIWALHARATLRRPPPPPLRPLLAIHLAPASVLAIAAQRVGYDMLALLFVAIAVVIFTALALRARWVTAAGFSPLWGAFTFPMGAFAGALIAVGGIVGPVGWVGGLVLAAASLAVPAIAWRVMRMWANGRLAEVTNAATA